MRLFTALWLPPGPARHLERAVDGVDRRWLAETTAGLRGFRFLPPSRWHLTLCFHGEVAEPDRLGTRLERRVRRLSRHEPGLTAPRMRLAGTGVFRGVLWMGAEPASEDDVAALGDLVRAAGADARTFRAHMTVARWGGGRPPESLRGLFADYSGPWWNADEVALVRSEQGQGPPVYSTVHRVPVPVPGQRPQPGLRGGFEGS